MSAARFTTRATPFVVFALTALLGVGSARASQLTLQFTAPGDDGYDGRATSYELRWSRAPIDSTNYGLATPVPGLPAPAMSGVRESFVIDGLPDKCTYWIALKAVDDVGNWSGLSNVVVCAIDVTAAGDASAGHGLRAPSPNPARRAARIGFAMPRAGAASVDVYDVTGRRIRQLMSATRGAGEGEVTWDLSDESGMRVAPGLYLVHALLAGRAFTQRVLVVR